jgi:hypothetical protein
MRLASLICALALVPTLAGATEPAAPPAKGRRPPSPAPARRPASEGPDVLGGYSHLDSGAASLNGWHLSGSRRFRGRVRLAADFSGHYGSFADARLSQITLLVGPRFVWAAGRLRPFGEALLGVARGTTTVDLIDGSLSDTHNDWGGALGGGADYRLGHRWAARAQLDLLLMRAAGAWESSPRLSVGSVYRFER